MKRHNLRKRVADKVKISRAIINKDTIDEFFNNISEELEGVPPERLFNIDETHFTDDPDVLCSAEMLLVTIYLQWLSTRPRTSTLDGLKAVLHGPYIMCQKMDGLMVKYFSSGFSTYSCQRHKK